MTGFTWSHRILYAGLLAAAYALGRWQTASGPEAPTAHQPAAEAKPPAPVKKSVLPAQEVLPSTSASPAKSETGQAMADVSGVASLPSQQIERRLRSLPPAQARQFAVALGREWAATKSPLEVLSLCRSLSPEWRFELLRGASLAWVERTARADASVKDAVSTKLLQLSERPGVRDATFTSLLTEAQVADEIVSAWMNTAGRGPHRADSLSSLATITSAATADYWFQQTQGWTNWEREQFARETLQLWAQSDPEAAWRWAQLHPQLATQEGIKAVLGSMDEARLNQLFATTRAPDQRLSIVAEMARRRATADTAAAVAWADGLASETEREAAQGAIYDAVPRGIGAVLGSEGGFPKLVDVTPGSAALQAGLQAGDRLVEIIDANGSRHSLHGEPLSTVVSYIRGEPGTTVQLRILRTDARGTVTEQWVPVTRQQLLFKTKP